MAPGLQIPARAASALLLVLLAAGQAPAQNGSGFVYVMTNEGGVSRPQRHPRRSIATPRAS